MQQEAVLAKEQSKSNTNTASQLLLISARGSDGGLLGTAEGKGVGYSGARDGRNVGARVGGAVASGAIVGLAVGLLVGKVVGAGGTPVGIISLEK